MAEYIDRDKALKEFDAWVESTGALSKGTSYYAEARGCIECVPAADVEPVRHGRWKLEPTNPYDNPGYKNRMIKRCSCCGWQNACRRNYCPNCGAKMDGEVTE